MFRITPLPRSLFLRGTPVLLCHPTQHGSFVSPYRVLDVTPNTPFEDIRRRFHELTQQYHPDMPTGDANKFRDINAAYRQIRAEYRQQTSGFHEKAFAQGRATGRQQATGGDFWQERNEQIRKANERMEAARRRAEEREEAARSRAAEKNRSVLRRCYDYLYGAEIWISLGLTVVVFIYAGERYYTMQRMIDEKNLHLHNIDHGLPPPLPMEVDEALKAKYDKPLDAEERKLDSLRVVAESRYRKATQRRFDDFREFMYVYDPDGIAMRTVRTDRFSFQYMRESEIAKRCPIIKDFDSEKKQENYATTEKALQEQIKATPWSSPDMGQAASLVVKGLGCIPAVSPNTAKWTFIEYADRSKKPKDGRRDFVCLVALRNHRFDQVGMCQRVSITGREDLVPELVAAREENLKSGKLRKKNLVSGGALPIKDLSIPLKDMQL